ncbi:FMN-linked oxidoreductase [Aureobasidium pullulans]|uniref:tRNA-dihydrouridine(16/17) synthase [NAD(P)(+)] n=1 Tax=Aureobasidium pullulans TaxID=5580 RepID=A0A4S9BUC4_AURPU|nr:FMN-linked oxidoreductase [Aureobasidium pullulans]THZ42623.1 FMN-linked oxidoreductase [Aureobasidium pullulans]
MSQTAKAQKLHGRAFYESIGSPKLILAPMVEQSEFAWRLLTRSFMPAEQNKQLLAYTPMFHARLFHENPKYREAHFQPLKGSMPDTPDPYHQSQFGHHDHHLDGNHETDRPLFVQFCANDPNDLLAAARHVQPFCDAVDLNLGCPQGIARKGHYGSFLQEDWDLIYKLINNLHTNLDIPVTAKMRILDTREKTLDYAKMILSAGASIITVHGRQRHQKGHNTGLADWAVIRYLRENLPSDTVIFANGNILRHDDIPACLEATGADGVMSAEGNLYDPSVFAQPPPAGQEGREYWRGKDGRGGYRMDAVLRRYMDIIHRYVLGQDPPARKPLFLPGDDDALPNTTAAQLATEPSSAQKRPAEDEAETTSSTDAAQDKNGQPPSKKQKQGKGEVRKKAEKCTNPNLTPMQAHLFHMLRPLVSKHTNVRDALARCRAGDMAAYENVLAMVEAAVKEGLLEYEASPPEEPQTEPQTRPEVDPTKDESSLATVAWCKRPWFICQPYVRPLPKEALEKGSMQLTRKEKERLEREKEENKQAGLEPEGRVEEQENNGEKVEVPKEGMVCG